MPDSGKNIHENVILESSQLSELIAVLAKKGYQVIGPTERDHAIIYDEIQSMNDLPIGWTDEQSGGHYRIHRNEDPRIFHFTVGPQSWKKFLFPSMVKLWEIEKNGKDQKINSPQLKDLPKYAFLGVRACELAAIAIQDKVFLHGEYTESIYQTIREDLIIIAVNCTKANETCFCESMNTGPKATTGFDLALTEIIQPNKHYFLVEIGTERGADILKEISYKPAKAEDKIVAQQILTETALLMGRTLNTLNIKELLYDNFDHPIWEEIAGRCLSCANCTMVCPTCFCHTIEDYTDLSGHRAERRRKWDSCFTVDFSYIHGGGVRTSVMSRYRQWLTHKLGAWIDQFGTSGCVGCGRCITWCPVGIDLTEEIQKLRKSELVKKEMTYGQD